MKTRVLVYDIETSPLLCYTWDKWPQNGVIEVVQDWQILTVAWQWLGEKTVHVKGQDDFEDYVPGVNNDLNIVKLIHSLYEQADAVVAHNGDRFDQKKSQARMVIHGLTPPSPYKQIDTQKIAKRVGAFTSNRLKDLAKDMDVAQKGDPGGFETWKGCLAGDPKAWRKMKRYNKQDIPPLMDLYLKFRPWDKQALQMNVLEGRPDACPKCLGTHINAGTKYRPTNSNLYQYFRCMDCGASIKRRMPEPNIKPLYVNG